MPELPEVETALRGVSPYLKGFTIEKIVVHQPQLRWVISPELTTLKNIKILDISCRAKYLIIHTEKGYIIGHLGILAPFELCLIAVLLINTITLIL